MFFLGLIDGTRWCPKLPWMTLLRLRSTLRHPLLGFVLTAGVLTACERAKPTPRSDSLAAIPATTAEATAPDRDMSGWNRAAGPVLLVPGRSQDEAVVLLPFPGDIADEARLDSLGEQQGSVLLLGRGGATFSGQLAGVPDESDPECQHWPLRDVRGSVNATEWAVGFVEGRAVPLPLDSVQVLSTRDSVALAAEASRLASAVTAPTGPSFQGLRFTVHDVRRFQAAPGVQAIVAHLFRRVNTEANPQEEQTLLIAERDSGATSGSYRLAYAERGFGREEEVTTPEVVAGVRLGASSPSILVIARDAEEGISYSFVERTGPRRWRVRWTSGKTTCS
jgi:hypothetical protein